MKLKELRIGNLIHHKYSEPNFIVSEVSGFGDKTVNGIQLEDIEPIPLTDEWLVSKMGFKKVKVTTGHQYHLQISQHFRITVRQDFHVYLPYNYPSGFHKCVHELQNLYYFLKNEELIINQ